MRIAELEARLLANAETQRNAEIAIERLTLALSEAQAAFEAEHPRLRAAIDPLEEAVKTAQAQVASSQAALDTLPGRARHRLFAPSVANTFHKDSGY